MRTLTMRQTLSSGLTHTTITRISILVLLSMADYVLTCHAVSSGLGNEGNPLLSGLSLEGIGLAKTVGMVTILYFFWSRPKVLYPVGAIMATILYWNVGVILI